MGPTGLVSSAQTPLSCGERNDRSEAGVNAESARERERAESVPAGWGRRNIASSSRCLCFIHRHWIADPEHSALEKGGTVRFALPSTGRCWVRLRSAEDLRSSLQFKLKDDVSEANLRGSGISSFQVNQALLPEYFRLVPDRNGRHRLS